MQNPRSGGRDVAPRLRLAVSLSERGRKSSQKASPLALRPPRPDWGGTGGGDLNSAASQSGWGIRPGTLEKTSVTGVPGG